MVKDEDTDGPYGWFFPSRWVILELGERDELVEVAG
jgi:hypothetical protein